jgi:hypothetical protein
MPSSNPSSLHERPVIATQSKPSASFPPSSSSASHPSSSSSGSSTWVVLVCLLVWLHGASFGATLGDGVLKPLMVLTVMFFGPIIAVWSLPAARRLLVAFLYVTSRRSMNVVIIRTCCVLNCFSVSTIAGISSCLAM